MEADANIHLVCEIHQETESNQALKQSMQLLRFQSYTATHHPVHICVQPFLLVQSLNDRNERSIVTVTAPIVNTSLFWYTVVIQ